MRLWFEILPDGDVPAPLVAGRFNADGAPGADAVVSVGEPPATGVVAAAWMVPPGLGGHVILLRALAARGDAPILLAINGLGSKALAVAHAALGDADFLHLFDARDQDPISYLEQLAWLQAQTVPFAVMARSTEKLAQAVAAGAKELVVPAGASIDPASVARVAEAAGAGASRPLSSAEADHLYGREASLSVTRALKKGDVLTAADLTVIVTKDRGVAPYLDEGIVGRTLRYDIEPGTVLHFGHLRGENHD